jgi:hypothetical protein
MKFMCLAYEDEKIFAEMSREDWEKLRHETVAYVESLRASGHLIAAHALQSLKKSATVRVRNGSQLVMDGPFAEAKEQVGGFFLIEAKDREEALRLAARWPSARLGAIEVRPIEETLRADRRY